MTNPNKRKKDRIPCEFDGYARIGDNTQNINIVDINIMGAKIITINPLPKNKEIEIAINLPNNEILKLKTRVVWSSETGRAVISGLKFSETDISLTEQQLAKAGLIDKKSKINRRREMYDTVFESYHDEVFLRRVEEFVDFIKETDPDKGLWAETLLKDLKKEISAIKDKYKKWSEE